MPRRCTSGWLPRPVPLLFRRGTHVMQPGEPECLELQRFSSREGSIHAAQQMGCCKCGLQHLHDYEVRREGRKWFLVIRSYRLEI